MIRVLILFSASLSGVVAQASFSRSINLGAILVAMLIIIVAGLFTVRDKVTKAQIDGWRGNFEAEKERSDILARELRTALETISEQKVVLEKLQALPNLERVVKFMAETAEHQLGIGRELTEQATAVILEAMEDHERRAEARHLKLLSNDS